MDATSKTINTIRGLAEVPFGGIRNEYIERWINQFRNNPGNENQADFKLTKLQEIVANSPEAFDPDGKNMIITGPTSAGKTLVAEMIMANHITRAQKPRGCIFAVPLRALTTEKYERFQQIFGNKGVYASSSDYQQFDWYILNREFSVVVVVYEKLYSWLLNPQYAQRILRQTGLLIVDELHMISDVQRGPKLEMILTFVRQHQRQPQKPERELRIVGLGTDEQALSKTREWLDASSINTSPEERPVPLVEGYIRKTGEIHLQPLPNVLRENLPGGRLPLPQVRPCRDSRELALNFISGLLARPDGTRIGIGEGKRVLVYSATKNRAEEMANELAQVLGNRQQIDAELHNVFEELEETVSLGILRKTIPAGVGFHHGDLTMDERLLVESLFKTAYETGKNSLDIVISTPTLSMGVNLPADYMLFPTIDTFQAREWIFAGVMPDTLSRLEYRNFAGRAGRYRPNMPKDHHGVALFLTDLETEDAERDLVQGLMLGKVDPMESSLNRWPFGIAPLALGALGWIEALLAVEATPNSVRNIFASTYGGFNFAHFKTSSDEALPVQEAAVSELKKLPENLVVQTPEDKFYLERGTPELKFSLTLAGKAVAKHGIHIRTFQILEKLALKLPDILNNPLVILEELAQAPEVVRLYPSKVPNPNEMRQTQIALRRFFKKLKDEGYTLGVLAEKILQAPYVSGHVTLSYLRRTAAAWMWMQGESADSISSSPILPEIRYGSLITLTDQLSWLVGALRDIWLSFMPENQLEDEQQLDAASIISEQIEADKKLNRDLTNMELRLRYGVKEKVELVAGLHALGWHRSRLMKLWEMLGGWNHPVDILSHSLDEIPPAWRRIFIILRKKINDRDWDDDPRSMAQRQVAIARQMVEVFPDQINPIWPELIAGIHLTKNDQLLENLQEALQKKPFSLKIHSNQNLDEEKRSAAPDLLVEIAESLHYGIVLVGRPDKELQWSDIIGNRIGPNGKPLEHLICLAEGEISQIEEDHMKSGLSRLVLTREALGQLLIRSLQDPTESGSVQDGTALTRVLTLLKEGNRVARTAKDVDNLLTRGFTPLYFNTEEELRIINSRKGRAESQPQTSQTQSPNPTELYNQWINNSLSLLEDRVKLFENIADDWGVAYWIRQAIRLMPDLPAMCAARSRIIVETITKNVYEWTTNKSAPDSFSVTLDELKNKNLFNDNQHVYKTLDFIRDLGNKASHPQRILVDGATTNVPAELDSDSAITVLHGVLVVSKWYLDLIQKIHPTIKLKYSIAEPVKIADDTPGK